MRSRDRGPRGSRRCWRRGAESGRHDAGDVFQGNPADGEGRQAISAATARRRIQAGELLETLGCRRERRTDAEVVGAIEDRLPRLLDRMRRDADEGLRADDRPGVLDRKVFLAEVYAVGPDQRGQIGPVVDHQESHRRMASCRRRRPRPTNCRSSNCLSRSWTRGGTGIEDLAGKVLEVGRRGAAFQQDAEPGPAEPLAARAGRFQGAARWCRRGSGVARIAVARAGTIRFPNSSKLRRASSRRRQLAVNTAARSSRCRSERGCSSGVPTSAWVSRAARRSARGTWAIAAAGRDAASCRDRSNDGRRGRSGHSPPGREGPRERDWPQHRAPGGCGWHPTGGGVRGVSIRGASENRLAKVKPGLDHPHSNVTVRGGKGKVTVHRAGRRGTGPCFRSTSNW